MYPTKFIYLSIEIRYGMDRQTCIHTGICNHAHGRLAIHTERQIDAHTCMQTDLD